MCTSQKYVGWSHFLTFTGNKKKRFGTKPIWDWIYDKGWKNHHPNYNDLLSVTQNEINEAFNNYAHVGRSFAYFHPIIQ